MAVITNFGVPVTGETGSTLMPKLQYRFRVTFTNLGGASGTKVTRNVMSVGRPSLTHDDVTIDTYNSKIRLAGKHTWNDITMTVRDDIDSEVVKLIGAQLNRQVNHADQESSKSGAGYKFGMKIEMLDGSHDEGDAGVIDSWELVGCFLSDVQYGELSYATSEVVQVQTTIRYDNAAHMVGGNDVLSNIGVDLSDDGSATAGNSG